MLVHCPENTLLLTHLILFAEVEAEAAVLVML